MVDLKVDNCGEWDDLADEKEADVPVRGPEPLALRGHHGLVAHHGGVEYLWRVPQVTATAPSMLWCFCGKVWSMDKVARLGGSLCTGSRYQDN